MILELIKLLFHCANYAAKTSAKNQAGPAPLDDALYPRRATNLAQYINIATKAMIDDGKKAEDVKIILAKRGLYKDYFDMVLERAQLNYTAWFNESGGKSATAFELYQQSIQTHSTPKSFVEI